MGLGVGSAASGIEVVGVCTKIGNPPIIYLFRKVHAYHMVGKEYPCLGFGTVQQPFKEVNDLDNYPLYINSKSILSILYEGISHLTGRSCNICT